VRRATAVEEARESSRDHAKVHAKIPGLVKLKWQPIYREIDREYCDKVLQVQNDLRQGLHFQKRRALVAEAIRQPAWGIPRRRMRLDR